jgi:hypothetical protein
MSVPLEQILRHYPLCWLSSVLVLIAEPLSKVLSHLLGIGTPDDNMIV